MENNSQCRKADHNNCERRDIRCRPSLRRETLKAVAYPLLIRILKIPEGVVMENNQSVSTQGTEGTTTELLNKEQIKVDASHVVEKATNIGREQAELGKQTAASQAEKVANVIEQAATQLKEKNLRTLADYTSEIKATIKNFSDNFKEPQYG